MPAPEIQRRRVLLGLMALSGMAGCSSTPPHLYVLTPLAPTATGGVGSVAASGFGNRTIGVPLVTMPEYLDRPEIVSYAGRHELSTNRDDRWAERLPTNVTRVLAENLSVLLGTDRVRVVPSRDTDRLDYEVAVEFDRFERTAAGDSVLDAHWAIQDGVTRKVLVRDQTRLTAPVPDNAYPSLVAAMNENLTVLSRDIATAMAGLPRKGGGRPASENAFRSASGRDCGPVRSCGRTPAGG